MLIGAFATSDPYYQGHAERLEQEIKDAGGVPWIEVIEPWTTDTMGICCYKPSAIMRALEHDAVLWLDVDSSLHRIPDIGRSVSIGLARNLMGKLPISSQVHYWGQSDEAWLLLDQWEALCQMRRPGESSDHSRLIEASSPFRTTDITPMLKGCVTIRSSHTNKEDRTY